jgi:hypothetical protein
MRDDTHGRWIAWRGTDIAWAQALGVKMLLFFAYSAG